MAELKTKTKTKPIPNVGKVMKQLDFSYIPGESVKWYNHIRKYFGSFTTAKNTLNHISLNCCIPQRNENICITTI